MVICIPTVKSKTQFYINQAYVEFVKESGFEPILISQKNNDPLLAAEMFGGLLLPGGVDLDPNFYDEDNVHSLAVDPEKDDFERALLHAFIHVGKPIFGICRGFQLIVREYKRLQKIKTPINKHTTYYQHVNSHSLVNELDLSRGVTSHSVWADRNYLYGEDHKTYKRTFVNSMHHQALLIKPTSRSKIDRKLGGLIIVATTAYGISESKGLEDHRIAEAIVITDWGESRIMAVQWHPEELKDIKLLKTFFNNENGGLLEDLKPVEIKVETGAE